MKSAMIVDYLVNRHFSSYTQKLVVNNNNIIIINNNNNNNKNNLFLIFLNIP